MKERKVFITLALILGTLLLGMAYAAISTQSLNVVGNVTASASDANFDVKFTGTPTGTIPSGQKDGVIETYIDTTDEKGRTAVMNVSELTTRGQTATATFTVLNNSADLGANLSLTVNHTNTTWFDVTAELGTESLEAKGTTTLTVTVTLKDTPATDAEETAAKDTIDIKVSASAY